MRLPGHAALKRGTPHLAMRRSGRYPRRGRGSALQVPEDLEAALGGERLVDAVDVVLVRAADGLLALGHRPGAGGAARGVELGHEALVVGADHAGGLADRKSTRLNSSHVKISYAV